jgi:lipopolysaccharide export system protein LptA
MDALLSEDARLGKGRDEELIANILLNTVKAPVEISRYQPAAARPRAFTTSDWLKTAAAVIAIAAVGAVLLTQSKTGSHPKVATPKQKEVFFVVNILEKSASNLVQPRVDRKVLLSAEPGEKRFLPVTPHLVEGVSAFELAEIDLEPPSTEFEPSISDWSFLSANKASFKVAANATTNTKEGKVIYSGDVKLRHHDFELTADSLVMDKPGDSGDVPLFKALNATLVQRAGAYQTAADAISFNPVSGELVAKGVHQLLDHGVEQVLDNQASIVVFNANKYMIEERYSSPNR